jgi:flagellar hook-associated protein 3 FlgL
MRVTFQTQYKNGIDNIEQAGSRLAELQRQVSSGKRIERISDDPTGAVGALAERNRMAQIDQYQQSGDSAYSRLTVLDSVMSDIVTKLTSAQASATSALGSTAGVEQRTAAAQQLAGLKEALLDDFNASFQGNYVFAGTKSTTKPFDSTNGVVAPYAGSNTEVFSDVGQGHKVAIGFDGGAIARGSAATDVFTTLDDLITAINNGDNTAVNDGIAALNEAFNRVTAAQSRVGSQMSMLEAEKQQLSSARLASKTRLSQFEDANMVEAISGMQQADTAYKAALAATASTGKMSLMDYLS